jgi:hypothetical protein
MAMHARDVAADGSSLMSWNQLRGFDLDAMDWSFVRRAGVAVRRACFGVTGFVTIALAFLLRRVLEREQRRFGFARGFERLSCNRIDVKTPFDEWHKASRK